VSFEALQNRSKALVCPGAGQKVGLAIHLRPDANDLGGAALALLPANPELAKAEAE
jgi:hypothetical protein